ncbi:Uncharacterised protein [Chlamydia trachomatis]|nr:Uncharacterised protein [Chlamydia trachomatis]
MKQDKLVTDDYIDSVIAEMEDNMIDDLSKVKNLDDYKAVMKKHNM